MSQISNRFYVTALDDGTTLHGNLSSTAPLSQAWNGTSAVPNWTVAAEQPVIYLTLLSGGDLVEPASGYKWYYNGVEISNDDTRFEKTTHVVTYNNVTKNMPALKIKANLANSSNVDVDMIRFAGSYVINGSGIDFACEAQIRISAITANGNIGLISFVNGESNIIEAGQVITMYGTIYNSSGGAITGVTTKWYINDSVTPTTGTNIMVDGTTYANAFQVSEQTVVDHATIRCEFYDGSNNLLDTAYASVDDMQDPEFMYIQYNGSNGNAASLRKSESVSFDIWVGRREDTTVIGGTVNPTYNSYKVQLLDGDGLVIGGSGDSGRSVIGSGIPDADSNGYRTLPMSAGVATITIPYSVAASSVYGKKNMTGIVIASHVESN